MIFGKNPGNLRMGLVAWGTNPGWSAYPPIPHPLLPGREEGLKIELSSKAKDLMSQACVIKPPQNTRGVVAGHVGIPGEHGHSVPLSTFGALGVPSIGLFPSRILL